MSPQDWKLVLQLTGIVLGLLYLWLEYRADIRLWIVGLAMPVVHGVLYYKSGLYADFSMQLVYIAAGIYGLTAWSRRSKSQPQKAAIVIGFTPRWGWVAAAAAYAVLHAVIYWVLVRFTDSTVPFWDSMTTALCIVAYWMLSRKYVEQWLVWLAVDAITVGLYVFKGIPVTAALYALYCVLAVAGYIRWRRMTVSAADR